MNIFVTVLTLAAVFASSEAITYGQIADESQFLFNVGISEYPGEYARVFCGGVLISNYWVLTAAHCVDSLTAVTLHLGTKNLNGPKLELTVPANFITKHPNYDESTFDNDIALINTTYIQYTYKIHKVSLPSMAGMPDVAGEVVISMGWGMDENGEYDENNLKFVNMTGITNEECKQYVDAHLVNEKKLCANTNNGSVCYGELGGPLVHGPSLTLVGISSFLPTEDCEPGYPAVFVRVTKYLDWIKSVSGVFRA